MTPTRVSLLIALFIAIVALVLFSMVWYMMAAAMPPQIQGIVMITAALLIAFAAAKAYHGTRPMLPETSDRSKGLSKGTSIIVLGLFLAMILIVPRFILWLGSAR